MINNHNQFKFTFIFTFINANANAGAVFKPITNNHQYQWLAAAELYVLCWKLRVPTCFFYHCADESSEQFNSAHFCYNSYNDLVDSPVRERVVMTLKESRWQFIQKGDALPFEDTEAYSRRTTTERLTPDMLRAYGRALDIPFWDESAYGRKVILLRWGNGPPRATESALKRVMKIFGRPTWMMDRKGIRRPPK